MSYPGRNVRAYRPSQFGRLEAQEDDLAWREKEQKVALYAERAQAGLPLFETPASNQVEVASQ
ncbi:MAG: hypothetical protein ACP5HU_04680 [Phycisphaerae bacterium]